MRQFPVGKNKPHLYKMHGRWWAYCRKGAIAEYCYLHRWAQWGLDRGGLC